jgi:hypothetical protein
MSSIYETLTALKEGRNEDQKSKDVIKDLIDTGWSKDNASQMKAIQLLKGLALSDSPDANAFMKKLDDFTSKMKMEAIKEANMSDSELKQMVKLLVKFVSNAKSNMSDFDSGSQEVKEYKQDIEAANLLINRYK